MDEKDIKKILEEISKTPGAPKAIEIEVHYDAKLQEITGVASEPVFMSEGSVFSYLLQNIFMAHPGIPEKYLPGALGMAINGYPPRMHSPLFDGDKVIITAHP